MVPRAARPHLKSSILPRQQRAGTDRHRAPSDPSAPPASVLGTEKGARRPGDARYPRRKNKQLWPIPVSAWGGAGSETGAQKRPRGRGSGAARGRDQVEQPASREAPPLARRGLLSPDWWSEGANHRRLPPPEPFAGFRPLAPKTALGFPDFVARK